MQGWAILDFERVSSVEFLGLQRLLLSLYPSVATRGKNMKIALADLLASTIFAMACSAGRTAAQQNTHVERPVIPARTEDVSSIEGIVKASYDAISGGVGVPRDWGRDRTLEIMRQRVCTRGMRSYEGKKIASPSRGFEV
jgi:hypothetical protein